MDISRVDIHIMPTSNPDGFERSTKGICRGHTHNSGRTNTNGVDLNRNFPDWDFQVRPSTAKNLRKRGGNQNLFKDI